MSVPPQFADRFVAAHAFDAVYRTNEGEQDLLLEVRTMANSTTTIYGMVQGQEIRANSINQLVWALQGCISLSINHSISVLWNGTIKKAELLEVLTPTADVNGISTSLRLAVDGATYETEPCHTLTDAEAELYDIIGPDIHWRLRTCFGCSFSRPAFLTPASDRDDLRCYRDAQQAFAVVRRAGKFASFDAYYAGDYFVTAFHSCAAWQPIDTTAAQAASEGNG